MAKTDNFEDFLIDLANTIREKKGTTDLINPQDFSTEILSIQTGGSDEYGQSYYRIIDGGIIKNMLGQYNFNLYAQITSVILDGIQVHRVATHHNSSDFNPISLLDIIGRCEAFSLSNAPHTGVEIYFDHRPVLDENSFTHYDKYTFPEGDLLQKMVAYFLQGGFPEEEVNAMLPEVERLLYEGCTPITKEEFEALITSK